MIVHNKTLQYSPSPRGNLTLGGFFKTHNLVWIENAQRVEVHLDLNFFCQLLVCTEIGERQG